MKPSMYPEYSSSSAGLAATLGLTAILFFQSCIAAPGPKVADAKPESPRAIQVGVLSKLEEPGKDTSQGLYLRILREAGMQARAVSGENVRNGVLDQLDVFVIGGGSGTEFCKALGPEGGRMVEEFVRKGGGAIASCAGGYAFARGYNEATGYLEIANARCIDMADERWARGKAAVEFVPEAPGAANRKMFYANGPLWEITSEPGFGQTKALARFVSDVKKEGDSGGVMPGTPAILGGTFGRGRFVLFSAHPEFHHKLGGNPLVVQAARWVVRGPLAPDETVEWSAVFPEEKKDHSKEGAVDQPVSTP